MNAHTTFADDVRLFLLNDAGIVFSESAQKLFALNTSATFIWCCLEEGHGSSETAGKLQETFGISGQDAQGYVSASLADWRDLGFLAGATNGKQAVSSACDDADAIDAVVDLPPYVEPAVSSERYYRLLKTCIRVRFTSPVQEEWVHAVLAHLEVAATPEPDTTVDVVEAGEEQFVYHDGVPFVRCAGIDHLAPCIKCLVWQFTVNNYSFFLDIHAAVVGNGEKCFLFPGAPRSGKSSLTAALARAGFQYFSDEVALLEEATLNVRPVPLGLCVKSTGWDLLAPLYPQLSDLRIHHRGDGKKVRYLPPPATATATAPDEGCPVGFIVFPKYSPDVRTSLLPIDKVTALHRLMEDCVVVPEDLDADKVAALVEWIKSVDCYEMPISSLNEAVELVRGLSQGSVA